MIKLKALFSLHNKLLVLCFVLLTLPDSLVGQIQKPEGVIQDVTLSSIILKENKTGLDPNRKVKVYLPAGYEGSVKPYPVVYYLHSIFWDPTRMFQDGKVVSLIERGIKEKVVGQFIFVVADFSTPGAGSLYENSPVSGRWIDFISQELVPFIDQKFRTIRHRDSRAVVGDFMGGRGVLNIAMTSADIFSVAYAMHPVATGSGYRPWALLPIDWKKIYAAKSLSDLKDDFMATLFVTVSQAFSPNLSRPPFYCDFYMEENEGVPVINPDHLARAQHGFLLEEFIRESATNLRSLRGLAFDWGRFDPTQDHVFSNRQFSRRLEDLGINHESEEYRGGPNDRTWTDEGRFYSRVLPFLSSHLVFNPK